MAVFYGALNKCWKYGWRSLGRHGRRMTVRVSVLRLHYVGTVRENASENTKTLQR